MNVYDTNQYNKDLYVFCKFISTPRYTVVDVNPSLTNQDFTVTTEHVFFWFAPLMKSLGDITREQISISRLKALRCPQTQKTNQHQDPFSQKVMPLAFSHFSGNVFSSCLNWKNVYPLQRFF